MSGGSIPASIPPLVDIGANLAHESFAADLEAVLHRARNAGVAQIVVTGSSLDSSVAALALAERHPGLLSATAGLHPHHASDWNPRLAERYTELAASRHLAALGECGLDYFRDFAPRATQRAAFAAQLELAAMLRKPLFLHQREAHADFIAMLSEYRPRLGPAVVHCFTDSAEALDDCLALGCHIGITGWICDERRGLHLVDAVKRIPDERLMIETDAPYLLPRNLPRHERPQAHGQDARRNEPCYLPWVLRAVAAARGQTPEQVAAFTTANARAFFGLP